MGPQGYPGSQWYYGTAITGENTSGTTFPSSGISNARVNDKYLNTATGNVYNCTTAGDASVATWAYIGNIKGPQGNIGPIGPTGQVDFTTPIAFDVAQSRANLASGDSIATLFGKTQKWFDDINSGGASTLLATNLSENRALVSNASGKIAASSITSTELGYLDGATSNIQNQIGTLTSLDTSAKGSLVAAVNELNGKIPVKVGYFYLIDYDVTSDTTTLTLEQGRRFSDYNLLVFAVTDNNYFRNPSILPREIFTTYAVNRVEIDYSTPEVLRWVGVQYVSDTQVAIMGSSNNAQHISIYGLNIITQS